MTKELTQPETSNPNNKQYRAVNLKNLLKLLTAIFLFAFCNVLTKAQTNYGCYINSPPHTLRSPGDVRIVNSPSDCVAGETAISWDVFPVGISPGGVSFDGTNIWVSNTGATGVNTITKFRASDGANLGTFPAGPTPLESVFDGTNIWVANLSTNTLTKLRASDGSFVATISLRSSQRPYGLAFDGSSIWVASYPDSSVSRLRLSDGAEIGYTPDVFGAIDVIFDGTDIWVSQNLGGGMVTKINGNTGDVMGTFNTNGGFSGVLAFDGSDIWALNSGTQSITKLRGSDGQIVSNFSMGFGPAGIAFDGANMWVANEDVVLKYRASDGALLGSFPNSFNGSGQYSNGVAFDGTYIWVANRTANTVTRYRDLGPARPVTHHYGCYIADAPHPLQAPSDTRIVNNPADCLPGERAISWDTFPVGNNPISVDFDGTSVWVTNVDDGTVMKLRPSDGANLGTFQVGPVPVKVKRTGDSLWIANRNANTLRRIDAATGALLNTYNVRRGPLGMAFDGAYLWVSYYDDWVVSKIDPNTGQEVATVSTSDPTDMVFDGANIWVANNGGNGTITKIRASDATVQQTVLLSQSFPWSMTFDGANIWVNCTGSINLAKVRASDGAVLGAFPESFYGFGAAFDGENIWVPNQTVVLKFRASDGALRGSFPDSGNAHGFYMTGAAFDGTYVWILNRTNNTVTRYRDLGPVQSSTNIDPQAYAGNYRIYNTDTNTLVGAFTGTQALNLAAGNYQFDNGNQVGASAFNFSVNQSGQVTSVSNPNAAEGIGNTLRLKNVTININPQAYAGNYIFNSYNIVNNGNYTIYNGAHSFTVIPGLRYGIDNGTGRGGAARRSYFYFDVGAGGAISNIDLPAAAYASGSTLVLNNTTLTVEPNNYTGLYNITSYGNAPFVSGRRSFVLIPGMLYGFDNGAGFYEPTFNLDSNGSVDYVDSGFASAVGSVLSLSNVRVHVDPTTYGGNYLLNGQLFSGIQEKVLIPTMRFYVAVNNSYQYAVPTQTTVSPPSVTLNEGSNNYTFNFFVNFDETAPTTNAAQNPSANAAGWNNSNVNIVLLASDNMDGSGVREIVYSASGAQTISSITVSGANANLTITAEGETTVTYFARDNAGNAEATQSITIRIDKTPPVISNTPSNQTAEATGTNGAVVSWNPPTASDALDPNVSVACSQDSGSTFSIGTTAVLCTSTDRAGNTSSASFNITVRDTTAPVISNMPSNISVVATSAAGAQVSWNSPTATDLVDGNVAVNCSPASGSTFAHGVTTVVCTARDSRNNSDSKSFTVEVTNAPPTANAGGPYQANEGGTVSLSGAGSDVEGTTLTYEWDLDNNGSFETAGQNPTFSATGLDGPTSRTVRLRVTDAGGLSAVSAATVNVSNVAPTLNSVTGPVAPQAINTTVSLTLSYSDPAGALDTYTPTVNWGDGAINNSTSHVYSTTGVYRVRATVADEDGGISNEAVYEYVVVYDPNGGFVTGGGWIMSPAGAYTPNPSLTGKATFGFVSKYRNGANQPTGNTEFQFHAGSFNFKSEAYQWLVVAGARAQFKGTGSVNGVSGYSFILTATDGQISGGGGVDKFRIKIWNASGVVIYDNVLGASDQINEANPQVIGGGSIVIQSDR